MVNRAELVGARRRRSQRTNQSDDCIEVAFLDGGRVALRDSKNRGEGSVLVFTPGEWAAFGGGVTDGEFERP